MITCLFEPVHLSNDAVDGFVTEISEFFSLLSPDNSRMDD